MNARRSIATGDVELTEALIQRCVVRAKAVDQQGGYFVRVWLSCAIRGEIPELM